MKHIEKHPEPEDFKAWKAQRTDDWHPLWHNLQKPEKPSLHKALLQEQGYICCYCGQRITPASSHIEDLQPRKHFPELALDYSNLLASCPGYDEEEQPKDPKGKTQEYCGAKKDAWYDDKLMVSPLHPHCATYFRYTGDGQILPSAAPVQTVEATETIQRLGLDHSNLQRSRAKALDGILEGIELLSSGDLTALLQGYEQKDSRGEYVPFVAAIAYILKSVLP